MVSVICWSQPSMQHSPTSAALTNASVGASSLRQQLVPASASASVSDSTSTPALAPASYLASASTPSSPSIASASASANIANQHQLQRRRLIQHRQRRRLPTKRPCRGPSLLRLASSGIVESLTRRQHNRHSARQRACGHTRTLPWAARSVASTTIDVSTDTNSPAPSACERRR